MKLQKRNTTVFEYLPPDGTETDLNDEGEHTGEFHPQYKEPVQYRGNISAPSLQTTHQFYGEEIRYSHTLVMDNPNAEIEEAGLIRWKDNTYEIKSVHRSINVLSAALRQLNKPEEETSEGDEP